MKNIALVLFFTPCFLVGCGKSGAGQQEKQIQANLDYPQQLAAFWEANRLGGPQCDQYGAMIKYAANQLGPENVRVQQIKGYISSASKAGCIK